MIFTEQEQQLLEFAIFHHGNQKRKYTGEPYSVHLIAVATSVSPLGRVAVAVAICHDLIEDTSCTLQMLSNALIYFKYSAEEMAEIITGVHELTDFYTSKLFPNLNRRIRKELEVFRLSKISDLSKSVKYADIADNIPSIVKFDESFATTFIKEKINILANMQGGNILMRNMCEQIIDEGFKELIRKKEQHA